MRIGSRHTFGRRFQASRVRRLQDPRNQGGSSVTFSLRGKIAVVTGGAGGIGYGIAEVLRVGGASTVIFDIAQDRGDEAARRLQEVEADGEAVFRTVDVSNEQQVGDAVEGVLRDFGRIDILVNNAGIVIRKPVTDLSLDEWERVMTVNLRSVFLCCKYVLRSMIAQRSGCIVNISSRQGVRGTDGNRPAYNASKGGIIALTKALAVKYGEYNIRVNCILPAWILTNLNRSLIEDAPDPERIRREAEATYPMRRLGAPADVGYAVAYLVSDEAGWITGVALPVDGGIMAQ